MFEGKSILQIIQIGGITMYVLIACSVLSWAVVIERLFNYRKKSRVKRPEFMKHIRAALKAGNREKAAQVAKEAGTPFAGVVSAGIAVSSAGECEAGVTEAMERQTAIEVNALENLTDIVGTIGSTAVYIGLFGTVLGIIRAFHDISGGGAGGISVVIVGISEALVSTAAGLAIAIPAVIFYNYFVRRIENFTNDMDLCASEAADILKKADINEK